MRVASLSAWMLLRALLLYVLGVADDAVQATVRYYYYQGDPGERGPEGPRGQPGMDGRPVSTPHMLFGFAGGRPLAEQLPCLSVVCTVLFRDRGASVPRVPYVLRVVGIVTPSGCVICHVCVRCHVCAVCKDLPCLCHVCHV